jgi:2,5-dioxopentanoate dehydrogenase
VNLTGRSIIGFYAAAGDGRVFRATDPRTGQPLAPEFRSATAGEISAAARLAHEAFLTYGHAPGREKGALLRRIAAKIESIGEELVARAEQETALPKSRLQGETARTCGQLRLFAQVAEGGSWVGARIDRADPGRRPLPKPDVRSMSRPLGPVVVFGASNFPLAFSVAGGDTASALAAGNPVIVKAHPAHPGTSELVGRAVEESVRESGLPEGVFSLLFDAGTEVGIALVKEPLVKAVGFTGSRAGGRALMDIAASRPEPIPVFAEMSSTNPVFLLPGALRENAERISSGLHASFTLGAGQFCTKPGIVVLAEGADATAFTARLQTLVLGSGDFNLLTAGIRSSYQSAIARRKSQSEVRLLAEQPAPSGGANFAAGAALFETDGRSFLQNPDLEEEIFGPAALLVRYSSREELLDLARHLEGHLTATIHGTEKDLEDHRDLVRLLENRVGRMIFNGFPTGVEVCHAMVHGGPYPATSDGRTTSVGSRAILRFSRLLCYQDFPDAALPEELKNDNPLAIWRLLDGEFTREAIRSPQKVEAGR